MSNGKIERWTAIFQIIQMFMPLVDWVILKIEELFKGIKSGEEKKAIAMSALAGLIPEDELRGTIIDTAVAFKNATGEFVHGGGVGEGSGTTGPPSLKRGH